MKCWGPNGKELFSTYSTSPLQLHTTFFGLARGGEQPFPELAGRQVFVTATPRKFDFIDFAHRELRITVDYANGWPMVRWGGWADTTALQFSFYVFTM
jgi:hypothetical protein